MRSNAAALETPEGFIIRNRVKPGGGLRHYRP
jgi:hypothetical protein